LIVATGKELNAFEVTPTDLDASRNADKADDAPEAEGSSAEEAADKKAEE
jgi:hypothetical protein